MKLHPRLAAWSLAFSFILAASGPAGAQLARPRIIQLGLGGGLSVPVGHTSDAFKDGFHLKGMVKVNPPSLPLGLRGDLVYHHFGLKPPVSAQLAGATEGAANMLGGLANVSMNLLSGPIQPYVTVGLGAYRLSGPLGTAGADTSQVKFGLDAGAGVSLHLGAINAFAEARLHNVYTDQGFADLGSTKFVPVTFGVLF